MPPPLHAFVTTPRAVPLPEGSADFVIVMVCAVTLTALCLISFFLCVAANRIDRFMRAADTLGARLDAVAIQIATESATARSAAKPSPPPPTPPSE